MGLDVNMRYVGDFSVFREYNDRRDKELDAIYANADKPETLSTNQLIDKWDKKNPEPKLAKVKELRGKFSYLRSAYNEYGLNTQLKAKTGKDLYYIFAPREDEYLFRPDWATSLVRAKEVLALLEEHAAKHGSTVVFTIANEVATLPRVEDKEGAMKMYRQHSEEATKYGKDYNYQSSDGDFFLARPSKLLAAIPGKCPWTKTKNNCVYLVCEDKDQARYEISAIKKAIKMCEVALASDNMAGYFLTWSA